jgi:DNA polymerase-3 subunit epsilon
MSATVPIEKALPAYIGVFDTETDSPDPQECRLITAFIGIMDTATGELVERYSWLLNQPTVIPQGAIDVHGITNEKMRSEGTDPARGIFDIIQRLDIIDRQGYPIVIMNAPFDLTLVDREQGRYWPEMKRYITPDDLSHHMVFDPMVLDRAVDQYRAGSRKLVDLARAYGVPVETNAHDAEADCRMAGRIAIAMMNGKLPTDPKSGKPRQVNWSRIRSFTLAELHAQTIPTKKRLTGELIDYWMNKKMATLTTEEARPESFSAGSSTPEPPATTGR